MATVAETLNKHLGQVLDTDNALYKSLISDPEGTPAGTVNNPTDYNIGVLAGMLEWNRDLTKTLVKQLDLTQATGKYLDFIAHDHLGIFRHASESDTDFVTRIQDYIVGAKVSPGAIIYHMRKFSSTEPQILEGEQDGAFADVSFSDVYQGFRDVVDNLFVFPALTVGSDSQAFFFILILEDTAAADVTALFEELERLVAAGIEYEVQITY